ncbi:MAG: LacI family DNA-binding transcriptional regulator [Lactobacillales bacterium]|nr:LacI family DNA-binding transcriptional regulator [Lactobacillales bacterium]
MNNINERVLNETQVILKNGYTIREIAKIFNVSKSTVHKDLNDRLLKIDKEKHKKVSKILKYHMDIRHIRGGESTKNKYLNSKEG